MQNEYISTLFTTNHLLSHRGIVHKLVLQVNWLLDIS